MSLEEKKAVLEGSSKETSNMEPSRKRILSNTILEEELSEHSSGGETSSLNKGNTVDFNFPGLLNSS